jgi:hypothetical protein
LEINLVTLPHLHKPVPTSPAPSRGLDALRQRFLAILPRIELHARIYFRDLRCPASHDDAVAETLALAWHWFLRITEQGKDAGRFAGALATYAPRHERVYGVPHGQDRMDAVEERLRDNTVSPVPDQAAFRIDYPRWLRQLGERNREIAQDMALDHGTKELAARHKVSQGRISQLRRELCRCWCRFHGEA